jgi:hypothetical protein
LRQSAKEAEAAELASIAEYNRRKEALEDEMAAKKAAKKHEADR